ncbi:MAG: class I SAM-dependent methyltransferase [Anaerolineae bacterium]|nr:class I SAM-dependent methyltransferase [Anaerolineae bacterium]
MTSERPVCNYEGSRYATEFWTQERTYEDAVERIALRALLPPTGKTIIEIGAGFGRLADLYTQYDTVVIFDYARTQLEQAVERWGKREDREKPTFIFVQGDFYTLPFVSGLFDTVTMIRTLHHAADAPAVLQNVADILGPRGALILEFANKHNLKAILRYGLRRQTWSPFDLEPVEFVDLNFDFHPHWIWTQLEAAGLTREQTRTVSHFRIGALKRWIPTRYLVALDSLVQHTGRYWQLSPSVFTLARASADKKPAAADTFFRCPVCTAPLGMPGRAAEFHCSCGRVWRQQDEIYNFRDPAT